MSKRIVTKSVTKVTPKKADEIKTIADLLTKKDGNISAVAKCLKIARKTVYEKINKSKLLQDVLEDSREKTLDDAEDMLGKAIRKGEAWAVCFTLKTKGKKRGYVERIENTGANGNPIEQITYTAAEYKTQAEQRLKEAAETLDKFNE
jgi:hypothetical protein